MRDLGTGSFGSVKLGRHKKSGTQVAIKVITKRSVKAQKVYEQLLQDELKVCEALDHPHITRVLQLLEDEKMFYVVMELVSGGNLLERIDKLKKFTERNAAFIIW